VRGELGLGFSFAETDRVVPGVFVEERRRTKKLVTIGLFGEYTGYFSRRTELPMLGVEVGYAFEDDVIDLSRGSLLR
jgi:hypothetical protein